MEELLKWLKESTDEYERSIVGLSDLELLNDIPYRSQEEFNESIEFLFNNFQIRSTNGKAIAQFYRFFIIGPEPGHKILGFSNYTDRSFETEIFNLTPEVISIKIVGKMYFIVYEEGKIWDNEFSYYYRT